MKDCGEGGGAREEGEKREGRMRGVFERGKDKEKACWKGVEGER